MRRLSCTILAIIILSAFAEISAADTTIPKLPPVFEEGSIRFVAKRKFRPAKIKIVSTVSDSTLFTNYSVRYLSDNLNSSALLAIPKTGKQSYPAIVICHGFYPADKYRQGLGTQETMEALANKGFIVMVPDMRGFPPAEGTYRYPYPGHVIDIINGFVSLSMHSKVDAKRMGIVGYSMGGGYAIYAAEVLGKKVKAVVNYYGQLGGFSLRNDEMTMIANQKVTLDVADVIFRARSPFYHLDLLKAPVYIFHGQFDNTVDISQSLMLRNELIKLKKPVKTFIIPGKGHAFADVPDKTTFFSMVDFFNEHLKGIKK